MALTKICVKYTYEGREWIFEEEYYNDYHNTETHMLTKIRRKWKKMVYRELGHLYPTRYKFEYL
jgi:hypothetical protein